MSGSGIGAYDGAACRRVHFATVLLRPPPKEYSGTAAVVQRFTYLLNYVTQHLRIMPPLFSIPPLLCLFGSDVKSEFSLKTWILEFERVLTAERYSAPEFPYWFDPTCLVGSLAIA